MCAPGANGRLVGYGRRRSSDKQPVRSSPVGFAFENFALSKNQSVRRSATFAEPPKCLLVADCRQTTHAIERAIGLARETAQIEILTRMPIRSGRPDAQIVWILSGWMYLLPTTNRQLPPMSSLRKADRHALVEQGSINVKASIASQSRHFSCGSR